MNRRDSIIGSLSSTETLPLKPWKCAPQNWGILLVDFSGIWGARAGGKNLCESSSKEFYLASEPAGLCFLKVCYWITSWLESTEIIITISRPHCKIHCSCFHSFLAFPLLHMCHPFTCPISSLPSLSFSSLCSLGHCSTISVAIIGLKCSAQSALLKSYKAVPRSNNHWFCTVEAFLSAARQPFWVFGCGFLLFIYLFI